jgi:hypothetical protein
MGRVGWSLAKDAGPRHRRPPAQRPRRNDVLQGTLALLVLRTLSAQGRMHGYAIASHIQERASPGFAVVAILSVRCR